MFYNSNSQKSQLHHATKPCSIKVIHHFVENDIITNDIIAHLNGLFFFKSYPWELTTAIVLNALHRLGTSSYLQAMVSGVFWLVFEVAALYLKALFSI